MLPRVVVTGLGLVCPLGVGVKGSWANLLDGKSGVSKIRGAKYENIPSKVAAYVKDDNHEIEKCFSKSESKNWSLATRYALMASEEALTDAYWSPDSEKERERTGVAVGVGMMDLEEVVNTGQALKEKGYSKVSPFFVPKILANMAAGHIGIRKGFQGPNHAVSTACATGAHAIGDAFNFIRRKDADVMVCGGTEGVIHPLSVAGFSRMRALCTSFNDNPEEASRPFDQKRDGFVMGEGSGIMVLENLDHAVKRKAKIYAEILGYGLSSDGHHITAPRADGKGAFRCMQNAIHDGNIKPQDIGYINAHATSTPIGDEAEIKAIINLFADHKSHLSISSTKGATGHLLGAAGAVEAVFTVMACYSAMLPPTLNLKNPLQESVGINLVSKPNERWLQRNVKTRRIALTNSFGFGGTNASLLISSFE